MVAEIAGETANVRKLQQPILGSPSEKEMSLSRQRLDQIANPEKHAARAAVAQALKTGKLIKPDGCQRCPERTTKLHAHHPVSIVIPKDNSLSGSRPCRDCGNRNYHQRDCRHSNWEDTGSDAIVRNSEREDAPEETIKLSPAQKADLRERFAAFKASKV